MKKLAAASCVVSVLFAVCAAVYLFLFAPDYSADLLYSLGKRAEKGESAQRAAYFYEQSLLFNPYSAQARLSLTALMRKQRKNTRAEELLREGIDLLPSNASFYTELSSLLVEQGRLGDAVSSLDGTAAGYAGLRIGALRPTVQASPPAGSYGQPVVFRLSAQPGVTYYYTLDGSVPSLDSARYQSPIALTGSTVYTIRVIALEAGGLPSRMSEYMYDLTGYRPDAVPANGGEGQPSRHVCPYCGQAFACPDDGQGGEAETGPLPAGQADGPE